MWALGQVELDGSTANKTVLHFANAASPAWDQPSDVLKLGIVFLLPP